MKKFITVILSMFTIAGFSQNLGIGTSNPAGKLQINHRSGTAPGVLLVDSSVNSAGFIRFNNVNTNPGINVRGFSGSNFNNTLYLDIGSDSATTATFKGNGYMGIRQLEPAYPLDVNGPINTNGALLVNSAGGTNGQVLMSNGNGTMSWDNLCSYNNFETLRSTLGTTWTVPAGVTRIMVELWGAGGGGNILAGGGAGGYIKAQFNVVPGDLVNYITGVGGTGAAAAWAVNGTVSSCTVGANVLSANPGQGALYLSAANGQGGTGGGYSASGSFSSYMGIIGGSGKSTERNYFQYNATTFYESGKAGSGGDAPNNPNSGGEGQTYLYNTTGAVTILRNGNPSYGLSPGGGGSSGIQFGATSIGGGSGAGGTMVVHY